MRPDMSKLLAERPRRGHDNPNLHVERERIFLTNHRKDIEALENMPRTDSMKRFSWSQGLEKEFNENLNPLRRFLKSNVGRKWDDVYSELREHVDPKSTIQNHIMQHLWHYVERNVVLDEEGHPCVKSRLEGGYVRLWKSRYGSAFYVHPLNGKLLEPPVHPKNPNRKPWGYDPNKYTAPDGTEFRKRNGIWFMWVSVYAGDDYDYESRYATDPLSGRYVYMSFPISGTWGKKYRTVEQQCCKKDLKKYGLTND